MSEEIRRYINLLEAAIDPNVLQAALRYFDNETDWSGGSGETLLHMFAEENGLDPYDDDNGIDQDSPEFKNWFFHWAGDRIREKSREIERCFKGDIIHVYRAISAPAKWKPDPNQHPGIYWSWDKNAAEPHWGNGGPTWMMEADLHRNDIDWVATLAQNAMLDMEYEREIRVKSDVQVTLTKYYRV